MQLWRDIQDHLDQVDQPLLIFKSARDKVVDPTSLALIKKGVRSTDLTVVPLERSYHVATLDYDAELIFETSSAFFQRLGQQGAGTCREPVRMTARRSTAPSPIWSPAIT